VYHPITERNSKKTSQAGLPFSYVPKGRGWPKSRGKTDRRFHLLLRKDIKDFSRDNFGKEETGHYHLHGKKRGRHQGDQRDGVFTVNAIITKGGKEKGKCSYRGTFSPPGSYLRKKKDQQKKEGNRNLNRKKKKKARA